MNIKEQIGVWCMSRIVCYGILSSASVGWYSECMFWNVCRA